MEGANPRGQVLSQQQELYEAGYEQGPASADAAAYGEKARLAEVGREYIRRRGKYSPIRYFGGWGVFIDYCWMS